MSITPPPSWQICIDTGGTFTDCIAISPEGNTKRLKVLSNGVLRGKLVKRLSDRVLQVEMSWPVDQDIFKGFEFRIVGESFTSKIERVGLADNRIYLRSKLTKNFEGASFEIC